MTGLDKIVKEIEDEARNEAAATVTKAKDAAAAILNKAKADADAEREAIEASSKKELADVEQSRESARLLQQRQRTLQTKQELLSETLNMALEELYKLPEDEYFGLCVKLAQNAAQEGRGQMLFNEKDRARIPANFEKVVNDGLGEGKTLIVSQTTRPIDSGFVLKYGDVEENCSFAAMFDSRREEFSDKIRDILFA